MKQPTITLSILLLYFSSSFAVGNERVAFDNDSIPTGGTNDAQVSADSVASTSLQEILVKAPLIRREADRIVMNVAANPLSANKDAHELLKTAPGVWATDESLSIYGQGGTTVYIDDRKVNLRGMQPMTYLKSIPSSSIATIEIIPNAGAEYNADSSGGVIRINLKRNRIDGLTASSGMNLTAGRNEKWINPFVNLSLHSGKWTANFNGSLNGSPLERYTSHEETKNSIVSQTLNGVSHHKSKAIQGNMSFGFFFEPTGRDKLGLQLDYNPNRTHNSSNSTTEIWSPEPERTTFGNYRSDDRFHNFNVAFNWTHTTDDNGSVVKLITNYNYQHSSVEEDNKMSWSNPDNDSVYRSASRNRYNVFTTELSFRKVFNPEWSVNVGAKYTLNDVANSSFHEFLKGNAWIPNNEYDYKQSYDENIAALYATARGSVGRWRFKAGLRSEYTEIRGGVTRYNSFDLFPNANVSFNFTEKGDYTVALGYYRKIRRPSFQSLNPTVRQISDYTYTVGNAGLTPSFSNSLSLDFVLAGKFTIATGFSTTDNPIRQMFISNPDHPERLFMTWRNCGKDRTLFIHGDGFINITKWWSLYTSMTYVVTSQKLSDTEPFDTFGYLQLVASTTFTMTKGFSLSVNCFYNTRMKIGNITVYPILNLNPTLQKQFGKHWAVSVGVENMLQRRNRIKTESSGYERFSFTKSFVTAKIGATYKFNSGKGFRQPKIEKNNDNSRFIKE